MSAAEEELARHLRAMRLPEPVREYRFAPPRRWRADFAYPEKKLLIEVEGGVWVNGRHNRPLGFIKDAEKYNEAACLGYRVLRVTPDMIRSGEAVRCIERVLDG